MQTVREHFDITAKALNAVTSWTFNNGATVLGKISYRTEENARYLSFFIPEAAASIEHVEFLLNLKDTQQCKIIEEPPISQIVGFADSPERYDLDSLQFTKRIFLYVDGSVDTTNKKKILELGEKLGFSIVIRDRVYVKKVSQLSKPLAFISHDSRDKDSLVRELAFEMSLRLSSVWYDEYSLKVGDSLRENIERGLKDAKKCIVVLSPNFISNSGWTKAEFNSIFAREIHEGTNVILPIWHGITTEEVYEYSPLLRNRFALSSTLGVKELARRLSEVISPAI